MKTLSIRQPWAWLILNAGKDIENRDWPTKVRGNLLIHASKGMTQTEYRDACQFVFDRVSKKISLPQVDVLKRGGIVGMVEIVDCVSRSSSPWFVGRYGFVLKNPYPMPFRPCAGQLGFFEPEP
jgi:hypothetical protein